MKQINKNHHDEPETQFDFQSIKYHTLIFISIVAIAFMLVFINKTIIEKNSLSHAFVNHSLNVPKSEFRKYKLLSLENGMEVLIISDPLSYQSGASLSVNSGSYNDPPQLPGLSHFLEHMLFLGSNKYPKGDDYFKIITENNGVFNAYTDKEITNYFFDIHYSEFDNALEIFSRFFIDPLLSPEKINKEINAVNSEYEKNLISDNRKKSQIFSYLAKEDNPLHRFSTGNFFSLKNNSDTYHLNLEQELKKLHNRYYTSDKMKLVIYSRDSIKDLEYIVWTKFKHVKKSTSSFLKNHTQRNIEQPFSDNIKGSMIRFASISQENQLDIHFIQPSHYRDFVFPTNPSKYFSYIFESKNEGGLYEKLKNNNLISKLKVNADKSYSHFSDFVLNMKLTEKGIIHLEKVLKIIDDYLIFLKKSLIAENYFNFQKNLSSFNFELQYLHKNNVYEIVSKLSAKMINYPNHKYILDNNHFYSFNSTVLREFADNLSLNNSIIIIPNKKSKTPYHFEFNSTNNYEKWYKTYFNISKINYKLINNHSEITQFQKTKIPQIYKIYKLIENKINCNQDCIKEISENYNKNIQPDLLNKTAKYEFWFKNELSLDFNKTFISLDFNFQKFKKNEDLIYFKVLESFLSRKLKKISSKIKIIGNNIKVKSNNRGIKIEVDSFTILTKEIVRDIMEKISPNKFNLNQTHFNQIKEELTQRFKNQINSQPFEKAYDYAKKAIVKKYLTNEEYYKLCLNLNFTDFKIFYNNFTSSYYLKALIIGELSKRKAEKIYESLVPILDLNKKYIKSLKIGNEKHFLLENGNYLIKSQYKAVHNLNNALLKCFKIGERSYKNEIMIKLFHTLIGNIFFRELRTKRQFGYSAKSRIEKIDDNYFYCIYVQGSYKLPHQIDEAANEILNEMIQSKLENIGNIEFKESKIKNTDKILSSRFNLELLSERYFNNINLNIKKINNMNKYEEYSDSIKINKVIKFFKNKLIDINNTNLKITVYIYNSKVTVADKLLNVKNNNYLILNKDYF